MPKISVTNETEFNKLKVHFKGEQNKKFYAENKDASSVTCECCHKKIYKYYMKKHCETNAHMKRAELLKNP